VRGGRFFKRFIKPPRGKKRVKELKKSWKEFSDSVNKFIKECDDSE